MAQPLLAEKKKKEKKKSGEKRGTKGEKLEGRMEAASEYIFTGFREEQVSLKCILEPQQQPQRAAYTPLISVVLLHSALSLCSRPWLYGLPFLLNPVSPFPAQRLALVALPSLEQPHVPRCPGFHFIHTFAQVSSVGTSLSETAVSRRISFFPLPSPFLTFTFSWNMSFRLFVLSVNFMTKMCLHPQLLRPGLKGGPVILQT